jgi:hypothetical protein
MGEFFKRVIRYVVPVRPVFLEMGDHFRLTVSLETHQAVSSRRLQQMMPP